MSKSFNLLSVTIALLVSNQLLAQTTNYTSGSLDIDVTVSHPCNALSNGFIQFDVNGSSTPNVNIQVFGPPSQITPKVVPIGGSFIFNVAQSLPANAYNIIIVDENGTDIINSFATDPPVVLTALPVVNVIDELSNDLSNSDCLNPNGKIGFTITGGSKVLGGGGLFNYSITSTNSLGNVSGSYDGIGVLDLATLYGQLGLPGGTYVLTIDDAFSVCGASKNYVITDPLPSAFTISASSTSICSGSSVNIIVSNSDNGVTYDALEGASVVGTAVGNGSASFVIPVPGLSVGVHSLRVRATLGICSPIFNTLPDLSITVNPLPVPSLGGVNSVCQGATGVVYTTDAGQSSYVWNIVGGTITSGGTATDNTATVTWTTSGAQSISVNYTDANGCSAATATSLGVTVNPLPVPSLGGSNSTCIGATGVVYTTDAGQTGYVWNIVGGTITSGGTATDNTATVTWTTSGAQSISVNYTDANGCSAATATSLGVTVNPLPVPSLGGVNSVCQGATGVVYTTDAGQTGYVWNIVGGTITSGGTATDNTATVTWTTSGAQSISVNYTDANGCSAATATSLGVTVNPLPVPSLGGVNSVCQGATGVVYTTDAGQSSYVWNIVGGTITSGGTATDNTATVTWTTSGAQSISANYTDANGCSAATATSLGVTVNPLPVPSLGGSNSTCIGATGVVYTTDAGQSSYVWNIVGGTITSGGTATDNTATVTWTTSGAQSISVNYTDANGCSAATATSLGVTVNPLPVPSLGGSNSTCIGATGVVYTTDAGQSSYVWNIVGGTITSGGTATDNTATVTWTTSGAQSISVNYTDANGCSAAAATSLAVTVNPLPVPSLGGVNSVCQGATGVVYTTDAGQTNYVWNIVGGTITSGGTATDNTATVTWTTSGAQSISVNYTDANGCSAATATSLGVTVNPLPVPSLGGSNSTCIGATGVVYTTDAGQSSYVWNIVGGTITSGGTATDNTATVTWTTSGAQSISVNYTDANGCSAATATSLGVTVNPLPVPALGGSNSSCLGATGVVYTTDAGQTGYVWNIVGGTITSGGTATDNTATVTWTTSGSQSISVNYTDANGCSAAAATSLAVTVNPLPVPALGGSNSVCQGATGVVYTTDAGQTNYVWNIVGGTITSGGTATDNTATVTWTTSGAQSISVNYTDANGCSAATATSLGVTVNPLPVPSLGGSNSTCIGATGVVYTTDAGQISYVWNIVGGTITSGGTATDNTATVTWTTSGAQSISVNYTDANGCLAAAATSLAVAVNPLPVPSLAGPDPACADVGNTYSTDGGMSNYIWTVSAGGTITSGGTATDNTATVTWTTSGAQSISVNYTDVSGCTSSTPTSLAVMVNPAPTPLLTGASVVCAGATGEVYTSDLGNSNYVWTVSAGGNVVGGGGNTDNTITIDWVGSGPQTVSVNYTDANTCQAPSPTVLPVNVIVTPTATISGDNSICVSGQSDLTFTFVGPGPTWDFTYTDGTSNFVRSTGTNPFIESVNPILSTTYSLVSVTDATCGPGTVSGSATITVASISGNPATFGVDTWLGYVYDDSGSPAPPVSNIDFNVSKYRGFIAESDFSTISSFSSYNSTTDAFDLNMTNTIPVAGPTICGSYLNDYSIRFRMNKTFAPGIYTFTVGADDGVRLLVDGDNVLPAGSFNTHPFTTYTSVPVCLAAGSHALIIEYFDRGGFSRVNFDYTSTPAPTVTSPVSLCVNSTAPTLTASSAGALDFNWYSDAALTSLVFSGVNYTPAVSELDMSIVGSTDFFVTAVYTCGETPAAQITVDVINNASITLPSSPVQVCDTSPPFDLSTLVSGLPTGGLFTFSGAGVTVSPTFDPAAVGGPTTTITVDYVAGTCSTSATFDIDIINNATITVPATPVIVCESTGLLIDMTSLVSATPIGGSFVFTGTNVAGNNFDPVGLSGIVTIGVSYTVGGCTDNQSFDFDVYSAPSLVIPTSPVGICESSGATIDLTTLVTASPLGGTLTFSGTGVTGSTFNPATLAGPITITVDYSTGGGCSVSDTFDFDVVNAASLSAINTTLVCASNIPIDLRNLVTPNPTGGIFTFTGTDVTGNFFDPANSAGNAVTINVSYDLTGCVSTTVLTVTVRAANDPLCGGGGTGECATVAITPMPSPAVCSPTDGSIQFNINPMVPIVNNTGVRIDIQGISPSNSTVARTNFNDPLFASLPIGTYDYTIEYGDPSCIKTGQVTVLLGPDVVDFEVLASNANCFGSQGGVVLQNINGSNLADYTYEIIQGGAVVDAGTISQLESLTDYTIVGFGVGDFEVKLSQDQSTTTTCSSPVQSANKSFNVIEAKASLDTLYVTKTISVPDLPTGSMVVGIEESLEEPYEVRLELTTPLFPGQTFAQDFTKATRNTLNLKVEFEAPNLYSGEYLLSLRDGLGCRKDYQVVIGLNTDLAIPNIFTPNGDGVNEVFFIRNMPDATEVMITNRWGKQVYSSSNYQNDWNGGDAVDGVYYYRINAAGQSYSGWIEILRNK